MAVASFQRDGEEGMVVRAFDPPKTASNSHWYRAAVQLIKDAPPWKAVTDSIMKADIAEDTIIFHGAGWSLYIARKRWLK